METQADFIFRAISCFIFLTNEVLSLLREFVDDEEVDQRLVIGFKGDVSEPFFTSVCYLYGVWFVTFLNPGVSHVGPVVTAHPAGCAVGYGNCAHVVDFLPIALNEFAWAGEPARQEQGEAADDGKQDEKQDEANAGHDALYTIRFWMLCNHSIAWMVTFFMKELVLMRHGESQWNAENRFTGWSDVPLSVRGRRESEWAARRLREGGFTCAGACTSLLMRAIHTLNIVLAGLDCAWVPVYKDWRLNEKHYGILQGREKREVEQEMGAELVHRWRRAYHCPPPPLPQGDERLVCKDERYAGVPSGQLPVTESLQDTYRRVRACWEEEIRPRLYQRERLLVVAHGNSLRALVMHLRLLTPVEVENLEIPTCEPMRFVFDDDMNIIP